MTVRVAPHEEKAVKQLAADLDITISEVFRRGLVMLAAEWPARLEREELELKEGAELLARIRDLGHLKGDEALAGQPVAVDVVTTRRVVVRWAGHTFQEIGGRLVVARRRLDNTVEIAYLDGPEPDQPDVAKFFAELILV